MKHNIHPCGGQGAQPVLNGTEELQDTGERQNLASHRHAPPSVRSKSFLQRAAHPAVRRRVRSMIDGAEKRTDCVASDSVLRGVSGAPPSPSPIERVARHSVPPVKGLEMPGWVARYPTFLPFIFYTACLFGRPGLVSTVGRFAEHYRGYYRVLVSWLFNQNVTWKMGPMAAYAAGKLSNPL